jgi:hypothetical protein
MTSAPSPSSGWRRLTVAAVGLLAAYLLLFQILDEPISTFLVWIEFLAPAAGLSGLWMVFMIPVLFFFALAAGAWIHAGFKGKSETAEEMPDL